MPFKMHQIIYFFPEKKKLKKICVPTTLTKMFRPITQNTLIFLFGLVFWCFSVNAWFLVILPALKPDKVGHWKCYVSNGAKTQPWQNTNTAKQKVKLGTVKRASTFKAIPALEQPSELRVLLCHPQNY